MIWIAAPVRHRFDGQTGGAQQFGGAGEPCAYDEFLRSTARHLFEPAAEIVPIELAEARNLVHSQLPLVVLLDVDYGLVDIIVLLSSLAHISAVAGIFNKLIQKQGQVSH